MPAVKTPLIAVLAALALLLAAPAAEAAKRKVPEGFYGVMWDRGAAEASAAAQALQWDLMARSGVETVRTAFSWGKAQPVGGRPPSFEKTDALVALASTRNIRLLPVVFETPLWAARGGRIGSPPARVADYVAYLEALVRRYGPRGSFWAENPQLPRRPLREWQIWNEPHLDSYWRSDGNDIWAQGYATLLRASNTALERSDRGSVTVLAGLADYVWQHLAKLYRAGVRGQFDVAAMNFFTTRPRLVLKGLRLFRAQMRKGGDRRKPIWLTEVTWPASKGRVDKPRPAWQRAWETTDAGVARRLTTFYEVAVRARRRMGLGRAYWYTWSSAFRESDLFDYSGLVRWRQDAYQARPALRAYARSARRH
jgi:hypothetical protein